MPSISQVIAEFPDCKLLGKTKFMAFMRRHGISQKEASAYHDSLEVNQLLKRRKAPSSSGRLCTRPTRGHTASRWMPS
jgi:hypothetical protein